MATAKLKVFHKKPDRAFLAPGPGPISPSFYKFCESLSAVADIEDFLFVLRAYLPKKVPTGELRLFYDSGTLGLRRAYIKDKNFYEQASSHPWPVISDMAFSTKKEKQYFSQELGRPFSKALMIPLSMPLAPSGGLSSKALLLVEQDPSFLGSELKDFFQLRKEFLELTFKRLVLNRRLSCSSYLWSQLFFHWEEPLAILKEHRILKRNRAFQLAQLDEKAFFQKKTLSTYRESPKGTYQLHYYRLNARLGILYAQDITKSGALKAQEIQTEKMAHLCRLGKNMAHQLNKPLKAVQAMTQTLKKSPELSPWLADLEELENSILRSQKIIQSLLSFSQPKAYQSPCDLHQILQETLALLKSLTTNITLKQNLYPKPLRVFGDFSLFQQVFYNLIVNACQALSKDKAYKNPELSFFSHPLAGQRLCFKIKDNGPGIAPSHLKKIFQVFWSSKKQGMGFGLSLTQKMVQKCGGEIFVSSEEQKYTCFTLIFPLYKGPS